MSENKGILKLPGTNEKVNVVFKAPKMICASEHTIKWYVSEAISAALHRSNCFGALAVFLSVIPMVATEQQFSEVFNIPAIVWPGIFFCIAGVSLIACVFFLYKWQTLKDKNDADYVIKKLIENDQTGVEAVISSKGPKIAKTIPIANVESLIRTFL